MICTPHHFQGPWKLSWGKSKYQFTNVRGANSFWYRDKKGKHEVQCASSTALIQFVSLCQSIHSARPTLDGRLGWIWIDALFLSGSATETDELAQKGLHLTGTGKGLLAIYLQKGLIFSLYYYFLSAGSSSDICIWLSSNIMLILLLCTLIAIALKNINMWCIIGIDS